MSDRRGLDAGRENLLGHRLGERVAPLGATASEWGWANYSVPAEELMDTVRAHALRIAKVPADVLLMKKMALNRVADLNGFRTTAVLGAETDALLHAIPSVTALRETIGEHGLKEAVRRFKAGE